MSGFIYNEINLLPPTQQHVRAVRVYSDHFGEVLRIVIVIGVMMLLALWALIGWYRVAMAQLQIEDSAVETAVHDVKQQIIQHNRTTKMVADWFDVYKPWTPHLREVLGAIPSNIELTTMGVQESQQALVLTGPVSNRVDVVNFQRQLEELTWASDVVAPLSNFETGAEATFTFTIKR